MILTIPMSQTPYKPRNHNLEVIQTQAANSDQLLTQISTTLDVLLDRFDTLLIKLDLLTEQQNSIQHDVSKLSSSVRLGIQNSISVTNTPADPLWTIPAG
nr:MAG: hypothetical protein 1 [Beijing sediment hepe-like virus 1]